MLVLWVEVRILLGVPPMSFNRSPARLRPCEGVDRRRNHHRECVSEGAGPARLGRLVHRVGHEGLERGQTGEAVEPGRARHLIATNVVAFPTTADGSVRIPGFSEEGRNMRYLLLVGLSLAALAVACGGDDDGDTGGDPAATATELTAPGEPTSAPPSDERAEIEAACPADWREICADVWESNLRTAIDGTVLCVDDAAGTWVIELADGDGAMVGDECAAESHTVVAVHYP